MTIWKGNFMKYLITLMFITLTVNAYAKDPRYAYKCHVETIDKQQVIIDVMTKINSNIAATKVASKSKFSWPQQKKQSITKVYQCIPISAKFSSVTVNKLDENTLR